MSDTPITDKKAIDITGGLYGVTHLRRNPKGKFVRVNFARQLERENAALREVLIITTERLSHYVRVSMPVAPWLYATSAEEKASLEVLVKAEEILYPKAKP